MKYEAKKKKGAIEKVEYSYRNIGNMDSLVAHKLNYNVLATTLYCLNKIQYIIS